jgi:SAM-dependent methyltransferase
MLGSRMRARLGGRTAPREELVVRYAPGRTFADIGCMWNVHGGIAFLAEESGASGVTGLDIMAPTAEYEAQHARRSSNVRFVRGDLHDDHVISAVGPHDVVWCSGVLYHSPNPLQLLQRLRSITRETLLLASETIPEVPALPQACVFFPGLAAADRRVHARARPGRVALGVSTPFDPDQSYGAWWWGLSASAVRGMLRATGFELVEEYGGPLHITLVAQPT